MPISTVWILKYVQQCYIKWFWTISSLGAPADSIQTVKKKTEKCLQKNKPGQVNTQRDNSKDIFIWIITYF